ncbi:MAG: SpoIIE family protein phosphatase [Terracidiphilus sp.]|jgi:hypothetical protein
MLPHGRSGIAVLVLALSVLPLARAQVVDFQNERQPIVEMHDLWRFHTGDDPDGKLGWADPAFDDSSWELLRSDLPWSEQGYKGYSGFAWYRFKVVLPAKHPPLALYVPQIGTSYQVFAGGRLIGQYGGLPPQQRVDKHDPGIFNSSGARLGQVIPLPAGIADGNGSLAVAIRAWQWSDWAFFNDRAPAITIGDASLLRNQSVLAWNHDFWALSAQNALLLGYLLAAFAGLGLFMLRPAESEYLWFAALEFLNAALCAYVIYPAFRPVWFQAIESVHFLLLFFLYGICFPMFFVTLLKEPRGRLFWGTAGSALFGGLTVVPMVMGWMSWTAWLPVVLLAWIPNVVCLFLLLFVAARRGNQDARLLLVPMCLEFGAIYSENLLLVINSTGHAGPVFSFWVRMWGQMFSWPFPISVQNIADFLTQISILAILVLRFARTRRDEERHASELEAARAVQQVLVPDNIPSIPGFVIHSIYKPAGQVGGDFFQVLPAADGGVLVVIGDVSGKGMPAAMTVSLLVGTVRTLAHYTQSPGEILAAMNQRMLARNSGGFTTCLVLRCDADGKLTIANAGHIAPYIAGKEIPLANGLPLGLSADSEYAECCCQLALGEQLTLLTDGVVEARDKAGALFGFERSAALSIQPAGVIASAAQAFGQNDDITVLTVSYAGVPATA